MGHSVPQPWLEYCVFCRLEECRSPSGSGRSRDLAVVHVALRVGVAPWCMYQARVSLKKPEKDLKQIIPLIFTAERH